MPSRSNRPARWPLYPLLVLGSLTASACGKQSDSSVALAVDTAGCRDWRRQDQGRAPSCELKPKRLLSFNVHAAPRVHLTVRVGTVVLHRAYLPDSGQLRIDNLVIPEPAGAIRFTTTVAGSSTKLGEFSLAVSTAETDTELEEAYDLVDRGEKQQEVMKSLSDRLQAKDKPLAPVIAARARYLLGYLQNLASQVEPALESLKAAQTQAGELGLLTTQAKCIRHQARLLAEKKLEFAKAAELAEQHRELFAQQPEEEAILRYYLGNWAEITGNLRSAMQHLKDAVESAKSLNDKSLLCSAGVSLTRVLQQLGRNTEAAAQANSVLHVLHDPQDALPLCDRIDHYSNLGWAAVLAEGTGQSLGTSATALLQEGIRLVTQEKPECLDLGEIHALLMLNLAYAELQSIELQSSGVPAAAKADRVNTLREHIKKAEELQKLHNQFIAGWDILQLHGRLELVTSPSKEALTWFSKLESEASMAPLYLWWALLGQARAYADSNNVAPALAKFQQAEALLDKNLRQIAIADGRGSFLTQHELGTKHYVGLLLRLGNRDEEALRVIRHARSRSAQAQLAFAQLERLPSEKRQLVERLLGEYQQLRQELEKATSRCKLAPKDEVRALTQQNKVRTKEANEKLDQVIANLEIDTSPPKEFPPPQSGELLIACYPVQTQWVCLSQDASGHVVRNEIGQLPPLNDYDQLAARLLLPLRAQLTGSTHRLRLLMYGETRQIKWARLPWKNKLLIDHFEIVLPVDRLPLVAARTPEPTPRATKSEALMVLGSGIRAHFVHGGQCAMTLVQRLPELGWNPVGVRLGAPNPLPLPTCHDCTKVKTAASVAPVLLGAATATALIAEFGQSDLFSYYGHAQLQGPGGWHSVLRLGDDSVVTIGDIITRKYGGVPRWAVLIGCETGAATAETAGEDSGLAQAFLARGSEAVIATSKRVSDQLAAQLEEALYASDEMRAPHPNLIAALRAALSCIAHQRAPNHCTTADAVKETSAMPLSPEDWPSFNVYVP